MNAMQSLDVASNVPHPYHNLSPEVAKLDFQRLKHKYTATAESDMSEEEWDLAEQEYRRFLTLKQLHPAMSLVPSKLVDKIWHAHILDTRAYRKDCQELFGRFMDHYPYFGIYGDEDKAMLNQAFQETVSIYERRFGPYPNELGSRNASRCEGHACHVPSDCACRVPGTCK